MKEAKDICVGRKYTSNGEEKTQWMNIGKVFISEDGKMSGVINLIPTNWDGNFQIFEKKKEEQPKLKSSGWVTPKNSEPIF